MSALQPTEPPQEVAKQSKRAKWRKLDSVEKVRQALASTFKRVYDGGMAPDRGSSCAALLRALGKTLHDSELERRMVELERKLNQ